MRLIWLLLLAGIAFGQAPAQLTIETPIYGSATNIMLHPYGVDLCGGLLWVSSTGGDHLEGYDKVTNVHTKSYFFDHPYQTGCDLAGNLWSGETSACDTATAPIWVVDPATGTALHKYGGCGTGDGQFTTTGRSIRGLALDTANNKAYVSDNSATPPRVQIFSMVDGSFVGKFSICAWSGSVCQFNGFGGAYQIVVWNGEVYVAESRYIEVYALDGTFHRQLSTAGMAGPDIQWLGIQGGEIWASSSTDSLIHILDPQTGLEKRRPVGVWTDYCLGTVVTSPVSACLALGQFNRPGGSILDTSVSPPILYVADIDNYRYQKFTWPWGDPTLPAITPSAAGGTYANNQAVTWSDFIIAATINTCTAVGSDCTPSGTTNPVNVTATNTHVCAQASQTGWRTTAVNCQTYTLQVGTITATPPAGAIVAQNVTLASATSGGDFAIHYRTDGVGAACSDPTYSAPFLVTPPETVTAIGCKTGYANSAAFSAAYTAGVVTADGQAHAGNADGSLTSMTFNVVLTANVDMGCLIALSFDRSTTTGHAVTVGGVSATLIAGTSSTTGTGVYALMFGVALGATNGTKAVNVSWTTGARAAVQVLCASHVNQTTPAVGTEVHGTGTSTTLSITASAGDLTMDWLTSNAGNTLSAPTQTALTGNPFSVANYCAGGACVGGSVGTGAGTTSHGWTLGNSSYEHIGAALKHP